MNRSAAISGCVSRDIRRGPPRSPSRTAEARLLVRLLFRLAQVALLVAILAWIPWGQTLGSVRVKHAVLTFLTVIGIGKVMLDTFYYDRFRP